MVANPDSRFISTCLSVYLGELHLMGDASADISATLYSVDYEHEHLT